MLSVYGNDQETGTRIGAVFLSPDGRDLFFMSRTDNSSFANGILSFTHSGGLGSLNVDTTTGVPTLTTTADFGVPCTSGWMKRYIAWLAAAIVGAAIGQDGNLKVIGSAIQPLFTFSGNQNSSFVFIGSLIQK